MSDKKPREWWILPDGQTVDFEPQHFKSTHVIEKSAYDEMGNKADELFDSWQSCLKQLVAAKNALDDIIKYCDSVKDAKNKHYEQDWYENMTTDGRKYDIAYAATSIVEGIARETLVEYIKRREGL